MVDRFRVPTLGSYSRGEETSEASVIIDLRSLYPGKLIVSFTRWLVLTNDGGHKKLLVRDSLLPDESPGSCGGLLMRHFSGLLLTAIIAGMVLTACNAAEQKNGSVPAKSAAGSSTVYADGVRRVTPSELQAMINRNEAFVIDVRTQDAYNTAHIKGAKLIPEAEVAKRSNELPKDKLIITYCS